MQNLTGHQHRIIDEGAALGAGVEVSAFAVIKAGSVLGDDVTVDHFAVIGGLPQYLKFDPGLLSGVAIGRGTVIREGVTINRSIHAGGKTSVGAHCFLMANCHVGHDCTVGDHVILANGALLGGHVIVGGHVFIGGNAAVHQHCRIGEGVMIGGVSRITYDAPPFVTVANDNELAGLNLIGLKRRGFSPEAIADVKRCYRAVYLAHPGASPAKQAAAARDAGLAQTTAGRQFLQFFAHPESRGYVRKMRARPPESSA